ncbi:MAG TPA: VOC family protein [Burkholderiales bacterium]|nr:VOC family protein [Burkholderiales bacterium]
MRRQLRVARPVRDLARSLEMYRRGLELSVLGHFEDHAGFDGVMLGVAGADYHLEFTRCRRHEVIPAPTAEDLLVFYVPDEAEWQSACERMQRAGFRLVTPFSCRVVPQREAWPPK